MTDFEVDPGSTALVLIDLQKGIAGRATAPHRSEDVVRNAARLASACRRTGVTVVLVRVSFAADGSDRVRVRTDEALPTSTPPPDFATLVPEVGPEPGDLVVTKHQWGAFYGTDLDLHLRRRGVRTILLGGISTNFGVESTARDAWERAYQIVFIEDATAAFSAEAHAFAMTTIFPRLGLVRSTAQVLSAIGAPA